MNATPYCHPDAPDADCAICARCAVDAAFRAAILRVPHPKAGKAATPARVSLPCLHLGRPLPPRPDDPRKRWSLCDHPQRPLGPDVCSCRGCGPNCRGYEPDDATAAAG